MSAPDPFAPRGRGTGRYAPPTSGVAVVTGAGNGLGAEIAGLLELQTPLNSFVLPAGSMAAAQAHVARTIMRRAERRRDVDRR